MPEHHPGALPPRSLKSDDAALQISLGDAYLNLGQDDKALAAFDRATEISATPDVWNNIAYQLSLKKRTSIAPSSTLSRR